MSNPRGEATDIGLNTFVYLSLTFALLKGQASAAETRAVFLIITYYRKFPFPAPEIPVMSAAVAGAIQHKAPSTSREALPWTVLAMLGRKSNDGLWNIWDNPVNFWLQ